MAEQITRWKIKELAGKMREAVLEQWIEFGVVPAADGDGKWPESVLERVKAAIAIAPQARTLARRAFRLHSLGYPLPVDARRTAARAVLRRIRPASGKMAQVRREYFVWTQRAGGRPRGAHSFRHPLPPQRWDEPLKFAREDAFHKAFELAGRYTEWSAPSRGSNPLGKHDIPYEERFVLLLVEQLLLDPFVRNKMGIAAIPAGWEPPER